MSAAVGRIANVGDLYNARTDSFLGVSVFKKSPPPEAIHITDSPFSEIQYVRSVTFSEKFEKLNIKADLKVSILAGLLKLEGHGKYLSDEKKSARAVRSSLLYNIKTKVERLEIYNEKLKDCFSLDAISNKNATHVVIEVYWGANSMVTLEHANSENREIKEIEGSLDVQLKKIAYSVSGKPEVDYKTNEENKEDNFTYHIFADMLPNECLPQTFEEVLTIMKSMPSFVQKANDGKGKPLEYTLIPLSVLEEYLKVSQMSGRLIKQIDEQSIVCFVQLFDDISKVKQELNDIYNDMQSHLYCTPTEDIKKLGKTKNKFNRIEAVLRSKLATALVDIRSEDASTQQLESIRKEFENGEYSIEKVRDIINSYQNIIEKIKFADFLKKEGVAYIGLSSSIDEEKWKNLTEDIYVLFFSQKLKQSDKQNWSENLHLFLRLLKSSKDDFHNRQVSNLTTFIAVDLDICPEVAKSEGVGDGIRICHHKNGKYINKDLLLEQNTKESYCLAKSSEFEHNIHKPNKRAAVELRRPGSINGNNLTINKNVIICGETGSGKSSVVNLLLGRKVAEVSDGAKGCTLHFDSYAHKGHNFYDTAGFSEGSGGAVQYKDAVFNLENLLKSLKTGLNLLVYVVKKGRITKSIENNYKLFVENICKSQVPVILVVTGCDFAKQKQWAKDNQKEFENYGMKFKEYLSVCAKKEGWDEDEVNVSSIKKRYAESEENLYISIESHILLNGWKWINIGGANVSKFRDTAFLNYIMEIVTFLNEILIIPAITVVEVDGDLIAVEKGAKLVWKGLKSCLIRELLYESANEFLVL